MQCGHMWAGASVVGCVRVVRACVCVCMSIGWSERVCTYCWCGRCWCRIASFGSQMNARGTDWEQTACYLLACAAFARRLLNQTLADQAAGTVQAMCPRSPPYMRTASTRQIMQACINSCTRVSNDASSPSQRMRARDVHLLCPKCGSACDGNASSATTQTNACVRV